METATCWHACLLVCLVFVITLLLAATLDASKEVKNLDFILISLPPKYLSIFVGFEERVLLDL
jgi:hypothetical protein